MKTRGIEFFTISVVTLKVIALLTCAKCDPIAYPQQLMYLGEVGGKQYFADDSENLSWKQAYALCQSANMNLATVENEIESRFLASKLPTSDWYWLSAREIKSNAYTWEGDGEIRSPDWSVFSPRTETTDFGLCLTVDRVGLEGLLRSRTEACAYAGGIRPLCQL